MQMKVNVQFFTWFVKQEIYRDEIRSSYQDIIDVKSTSPV